MRRSAHAAHQRSYGGLGAPRRFWFGPASEPDGTDSEPAVRADELDDVNIVFGMVIPRFKLHAVSRRALCGSPDGHHSASFSAE